MARRPLIEEELTRSVIGAFYEVYNGLGGGLFENLYMTALEWELRWRGHSIAREFDVRVHYKGQGIGFQRLDMVVDDKLVVEAKSTNELHKSAARQLFTYLRVSKFEVGLLLHFGPEPRFYRLICENA